MDGAHVLYARSRATGVEVPRERTVDWTKKKVFLLFLLCTALVAVNGLLLPCIKHYTRIAAFNRTYITRDKRTREKTHIIYRT